LLISSLIILTHPLSIQYIILVPIVILVINSKYREELNVSYRVIIFVIFLTLTYWIFTSGLTFDAFIKRILYAQSGGEGTIQGVSAFSTTLSEALNYYQFIPQLLLMYIAFFKGLKTDGINKFSKIILIITPLMALLYLPGPTSLVSILSRTLQLNRYSLYSIPFTCLMLGIGLHILSLNKKLRAVTITILLSYCFLTVSSDFVASDNPLIKRDQYTQHLSENECRVSLDVCYYTGSDIHTDNLLKRFLFTYDIGTNTIEYLNGNINTDQGGVYILRSEELESRNLHINNVESGYIFENYYAGVDDFHNLIVYNNLVFNSREIQSYYVLYNYN
jgi:hypothetical protein